MASGDTVFSASAVALTRNLTGDESDPSFGDTGSVVQVGFFGRFTQNGHNAWVQAKEFAIGVSGEAPSAVFDSSKTYDVIIKEH